MVIAFYKGNYMHFIENINQDKNLYAINELSLITIYDDNWFVRNDYDVLSHGQRKYLINYFGKHGCKLTSGQLLQGDHLNIKLPKPSRQLAISTFDEQYLQQQENSYWCVTPTTFAETLFKLHRGNEAKQIEAVKLLIDNCPYNIEWLRDISIHSDIENITVKTYTELMAYQKDVIEKNFKRKKSLK
jgi:hypothetical protein